MIRVIRFKLVFIESGGEYLNLSPRRSRGHPTSAADDASLSQNFSYDISGRMLSNSRVGAYSYPASGAARPHAVTQAGPHSFSYDAGGNLTSGAGRTYTWDAENRPLSVTQGGVTISHVYGPDGSRLKLVEPSGTTLFLGKEAERAGSVWSKYGNADVKRKGNGGAATAEFLHRDHLASVRAVTGAAGASLQEARYRPYGERLVTAGTAGAERQAFIGERQDALSGLIYLNARFYDPLIASFVSPDVLDPWLPGVGTNRYGYSLNDPINLADKNGHWANVAIGAGIGAVVSGLAATLSGESWGVVGAAALAGALSGATTAV
nr:RHS repeat-associated core domain-containing protein [Nostoc sp. CHAB 5844]